MKRSVGRPRERHPGAVAVVVLVVLPVILGFAALTIDVGMIYSARSDMQRAADSAAIAGAQAISSNGFNSQQLDVARDEVNRLMKANLVLGRALKLDPQADIQFGRGIWNEQTQRYDFVESGFLPDSVHVVVRHTRDSPNGPLPLLFAGVFGKLHTEVTAEATAAMVARDIAIVADISGSQSYDSRLRYWADRDVNNYDVWSSLPGGWDDPDTTWLPGELPANLDQAAGPGWGFLKVLGYGKDPRDPDYNPYTDPGMIQLRRNSNWTDARLRQYLVDTGYSATEVDAILTPYAESGWSGRYRWRRRVATALGLARWNSGIPGGLWQTQGWVPADGDARLDWNEIRWAESFLNETPQNSATYLWNSYIWYSDGAGQFDRFGMKTVVDHIVYYRLRPWWERSEFVNSPLQPFRAQKDALQTLADLLQLLDTRDRLSLEVYRGEAQHWIDLTEDHPAVAARLLGAIAGGHNMLGGTNIGAGLESGINELTSARARPVARKIILAITDGLANRGDHGMSAAQWALYQAQRAADANIQIVTVTVGQAADQNLMRRIAEIAGGYHQHAGGSSDQYTARLREIFGELGLRREVMMIQ